MNYHKVKYNKIVNIKFKCKKKCINYATANCGAAHVRGYMIAPEVLGIPAQLDRTVTDEKAGWAKTFQDLTAVIDSMGNCLFTSFALGAQEYADLLNAATGTTWTVEQLLEIYRARYGAPSVHDAEISV